MVQNDLDKVYKDFLFDIYKEEDCARLEQYSQAIMVSEKPMFSFMMTTYNDLSLLNAAINSLFRQSFTDWELVILDNSDKTDEVWDILQRLAKVERRIHIYKSEMNVGWPKGASICLEHVKGQYTTFLAADDCINLNALEKLNHVLCEEEPDICWVGYASVNYYDSKRDVKPLGQLKPDYQIYGRNQRSSAIANIMGTVYYNSFFHYMKVDFLRRNNIDFFEPYYGDCAGMTEAMAVADKMIVLDEIVYLLTINTSQTRGRYAWNSYEYIFVNQWKSVKKVFISENFNNIDKIRFIALRIFNNLVANVELLCSNRLRNKYMNPLSKDLDEIIKQLEDILLNKEIVEIMEIMAYDGFNKLLEVLSAIKSKDTKLDAIIDSKSWLNSLFLLAIYKDVLEADMKLDLITSWLLEPNNTCCIGFEFFAKLVEEISDDVIIKQHDKMELAVNKYKNHLQELGEDVWRRNILEIRFC